MVSSFHRDRNSFFNYTILYRLWLLQIFGKNWTVVDILQQMQREIQVFKSYKQKAGRLSTPA
jgi:hypothetical protein